VMSSYIVCHKKRNNPRMDVRICQAKCDLKDDCKEYISYVKFLVQDKNPALSTDPPAMGLSAT
jgi:hypothetical protein